MRSIDVSVRELVDMDLRPPLECYFEVVYWGLSHTDGFSARAFQYSPHRRAGSSRGRESERARERERERER